jgi:predicted nucleic acid-binding protein
MAEPAGEIAVALSHLLDTSVYCQPLKPRPLVTVQERWAARGDDTLAVSAICEAELLYGLELKKSKSLTALYEALLKDRLKMLPVDFGVARHFASLKAWARVNGRPLSDFDLLIAATARAHRLTLATLNIRDFRNLPGVAAEDWSQMEGG